MSSCLVSPKPRPNYLRPYIQPKLGVNIWACGPDKTGEPDRIECGHVFWNLGWFSVLLLIFINLSFNIVVRTILLFLVQLSWMVGEMKVLIRINRSQEQGQLNLLLEMSIFVLDSYTLVLDECKYLFNNDFLGP